MNQFCQYKDKYWDTEKDNIKKAAKKKTAKTAEVKKDIDNGIDGSE